ncbi:MAG: 50S ribosomal protein L5 [Ignisphaera sp.]|uniref:Large ribosomal subunit protein uL5 n=1 Tax=Ignisphaera aggregans TaxID=334771 RepID=A0A7C4NLW9_9CREN
MSTEVVVTKTNIYPKILPTSFKSSILTDDVTMSILNKWRQNAMLVPFISKVVVNISVGGTQERLDKAIALLEQLTGQKPSVRRAKKTIKEFGITKRQPIATIVTLRGAGAYEFLRKTLIAVNNILKESSFDPYGNIAFGIKEHLLIPGVKYDPEIGIFGMDVAVAIERKGYRVMRRKLKRGTIPRRHRTTKEEGILLMELLFGVKVVPR